MFSPKDSDLRTPAHVHDISEEGSDMTREIYSAMLKGSQDGLVRTKSLPDVSEVLYKDVGTLVCCCAGLKGRRVLIWC